MTAADWCGLLGSGCLLVSALRDIVLRWWLWMLKRRRHQPGLAGLRAYLQERHQENREYPLFDTLALAAGATLLGLSYIL